MNESWHDRKLAGKIALFPCCFIVGLIMFSGMTATNPSFYSSNQHYQSSFIDARHVVFTTYFYWYKSNNESTYTYWNNQAIAIVNNMTFPPDWPGPRDGNGMVVNGCWHDCFTDHPPADPPVYNASGDVVGELKHGNISSWMDWQNPAWHEWHLRTMMQAGIDVALPVYWWNGIDHYWAWGGLKALVDARHVLALEYGENAVPKLAMFFDTTCMKQLWLHNQSNPDWAWNHLPGPNLNDPYWRDAFWQRIDDFYSVVDEDCAFAWNGKESVVWLYLGSWFEDTGTSILNFCKEKFQAKYNRTLLFVGPTDWIKAGVDGVCDWGACMGAKFPAAWGIPVGALGPGFYNIGALYAQTPNYRQRDEQRYFDEWHSLMNANAAWIHVETWNELHEGTDIAWSQEYGYTWITATRKMADLFHAARGHVSIQGMDLFEFIFLISLLAALAGLGMLVVCRKDMKARLVGK